VDLLQRDEWLEAQQSHMLHVDAWVQPRLARRAQHLKHPVDDFLFEYYSFSAAKLKTWHPGFGYRLVALQSDYETFDAQTYQFDGSHITLHVDWISDHSRIIRDATNLLAATLNRMPKTGCFGLHEWAMVLNPDSVRHNDYSLRLSQNEISQTITEVGLRCTHFDAFRFFTESAKPLNPTQLTRSDQQTFEQPGCLHANMDLYKYAMLLAPLVGSTVVRNCFQLARDIRQVDMQVAPYDLRELGVNPIKVETSEGRAQFSELQRGFADRAQILREALLHHCVSAI